MRPPFVTMIALLTLTANISAWAAPQDHSSHHSPYSGEQLRTIKSLSENDVAELRRGGGWGLAKAAELNGMPGPVHLLELKDEIALTPAQTAAIDSLFQVMRQQAITKGGELIALEKQLDHEFKSRNITEQHLRTLLKKIARVREDLRYIHLSTHLKTPGILTEVQVRQYNRLRGYR